MHKRLRRPFQIAGGRSQIAGRAVLRLSPVICDLPSAISSGRRETRAGVNGSAIRPLWPVSIRSSTFLLHRRPAIVSLLSPHRPPPRSFAGFQETPSVHAGSGVRCPSPRRSGEKVPRRAGRMRGPLLNENETPHPGPLPAAAGRGGTIERLFSPVSLSSSRSRQRQTAPSRRIVLGHAC